MLGLHVHIASEWKKTESALKCHKILSPRWADTFRPKTLCKTGFSFPPKFRSRCSPRNNFVALAHNRAIWWKFRGDRTMSFQQQFTSPLYDGISISQFKYWTAFRIWFGSAEVIDIDFYSLCQPLVGIEALQFWAVSNLLLIFTLLFVPPFTWMVFVVANFTKCRRVTHRDSDVRCVCDPMWGVRYQSSPSSCARLLDDPWILLVCNFLFCNTRALLFTPALRLLRFYFPQIVHENQFKLKLLAGWLSCLLQFFCVLFSFPP